MKDIERIYMNVPMWTGRKTEHGTPWLDAASEAETALSSLDSLLGEFGGIGFSSQMGILSGVTDGFAVMKNARQYLQQEIERFVDNPLIECFSRAVEGLTAIDFDKIRVVNNAGVVVNNMDMNGKNADVQKIKDYSLMDVLMGNVPEFNRSTGFTQKIEGFGSILSEMGGFNLNKLQGKNDESEENPSKEKTNIMEDIRNYLLHLAGLECESGHCSGPVGSPMPKSIPEIVSGIMEDVFEKANSILNVVDVLCNMDLSNVEVLPEQEICSTKIIIQYIEYDITLEELINKQLNLKNPPIKDGETKVTFEDIYDVCNPNNHNIGMDMYQFLDLSASSNLSLEEIENFLQGKGILEGKEKSFFIAAKENNISEVYLLAHASLETGNGTSKLATGVNVNGVIVYNMYGINATDGNAVEEGAKFAYEHGWDTPEKAIEEGAKWISEKYINNETYQQNTLYEMRWNPQKTGEHQYATDIAWALKQTVDIKEMFDLFPNAQLTFEVPVYKE